MARHKQTPKKSKGGIDGSIPLKKEKKKHRFKSGTVALRQIRRYQKRWDLLIPRAPFTRTIREILHEFHPDMRIQKTALDALQESAEVYLTRLFQDSNAAAIHAKRVTIMPKDIKLVQHVKE